MNGSSYPVAELVVVSGNQANTHFPLNKPLLSIGRSGDNDVVLSDEMVSKHHSRIIVQGNNHLIEDLGSSNGTVVNGESVSSHILNDGETIYLGQTSLVFRSLAGAAALPAVAPVAAGSASRKKGVWIAVGVLAGLVLVAGIALVLVFFVLAEKDVIKPEVAFSSPQQNQSISLALPVNSPVEIPVSLTASDDKGLDKVEIMLDNKAIKTFKAVKASKSSKSGGKLKQEDFTFNWSVTKSGDYTFSAKAYDWKGNTGDSDPVAIKAAEGPDIAACRAYVAQIDGLITEFVAYRRKFNGAYEGAKSGKITYFEAGYAFNEVGNERRQLLGKLNSLPPPPQFAAAHSLFSQQITYAIQADDYAVLWARDMAIYDPFFAEPPDPNGYEAKMQAASAATQDMALRFRSEYNAQRAQQLGAGPGPDPNG